MSTQTTSLVPATGTTFAVVGAGPGLGAAAARRFAAEGFAVALLARTPSRLDDLVASLRAGGADARAYGVDVRDRPALRATLQRVADDLGPVEVLQYSPKPSPQFLRPVLETGAHDLIGPVETSVYGPVAAVEQVLPGMRTLGRGSVLFVNGASAVRPAAGVAGTSVAFAAQSAYAQLVHDALAPDGVHVGQLIVPLGIGAGDPAHEPDALAERLWRMHVERGGLRVFATPMDLPADDWSDRR